MANQFVDLPTTASDGPGAWVDMSSFGALKTITVSPNGGVFSPFITVEFSNQDAPTVGAPLATFQQAKDQTFEVACHWMRAVTSNYKGGGAATCAVGGTDDGTHSLQLPVPAGNGLGAAVDVSSLPNFKTVQVGGSFGGTLLVLISEDGGTTYNQAFSFQGGPDSSYQTLLIAADFMRIQRVGVPLVAPGLPVVWVSATQPVGGGGGGGALTVTDGTTTVTNVTTLTADAAAGLAVTEIAPGNAGLTYAQNTVQQAGTTIVDGTRVLNFVQGSVTADTDPDGLLRANIDLSSALPQSGRYTVTGSEPSNTDFTILFASLSQPIVIANANFNSQATLGGVTNQTTLDTVQADNTHLSVHVLASGGLTAGDVIVIWILPFTPV